MVRQLILVSPIVILTTITPCHFPTIYCCIFQLLAYSNVQRCKGLSMVPLQIKYSLEPCMKRRVSTLHGLAMLPKLVEATLIVMLVVANLANRK